MRLLSDHHYVRRQSLDFALTAAGARCVKEHTFYQSRTAMERAG